MFMSLGLYANVSEFPSVFTPSMILGALLIVVSRPLAVFLCLAPFKYTFLEKAFISFVGLRGATSILLALTPLVMHLPYAETFFNIIFLMVLMSLAIQGFFIIPVARMCHVTLPIVEKPAEKSEVDLPGLSDSYLVSYKLSENTPAVHGKPIPKWAMPIIVKREGISYNAYNIKSLKPDDRVYLFASSEKKIQFLDSLYGGGLTLNSEDFGDFTLKPDTPLKELALLYDIKIDKRMQDKTICDVLNQNFADIEVGDRFRLDTVELIVRKMDGCSVEEIGLDLEPSEKSFGRLFVLQKTKRRQRSEKQH